MTANDLLHALLRANLAAGAAILIVIALRKPARRLAGARQAYGLWLLPLLALAAVLLPAHRVILTLPALVSQVDPGVVIEAGHRAAPSQHLDPSNLILALWISGALAAALLVVVLQLRFAAAAARGLIGPAVVGVLSPYIITPPTFDEIFDAKEQALVLAHEEAHIARHDSRANGLSVLLQCLFWFNPLIHLAAHLARIDQEMACDEAVITRFPKARQTYARALVKAQLATRPLPLGCCWPSGTEHPLEERIAMLKTQTKGRSHRLAAGGALAILCAATGLAAWAAQPPSVTVKRAVAAIPAGAPDSSTQAIALAPVQDAKATAVKRTRPPADASSQVCISNACMPKAVSGQIADAIANGDAQAVIALGGSGLEALHAMLNRPHVYPGSAEAIQDATRVDIDHEADGRWTILNGWDAQGHYLGGAPVQSVQPILTILRGPSGADHAL